MPLMILPPLFIILASLPPRSSLFCLAFAPVHYSSRGTRIVSLPVGGGESWLREGLRGSSSVPTTTAQNVDYMAKEEEKKTPLSSFGGDAWTEGGKVEVRVSTNLPSFVKDPSEAVRGWIEHHWRRGGGLPIVVVESSGRKDKEGYGEGYVDESLRCNRKRMMLPWLMEESLKKIQTDPTTGRTSLRYCVSSPGPFFAPSLVSGSHEGTVTFEMDVERGSSGDNCIMTWIVEYETTRFRSLYQALTEFAVETASRTVSESLSTPRLLTLKTTLPVDSQAKRDDDRPAVLLARQNWLEFSWASGGGLPLPPPLPYGSPLEEKDESASTTVRQSILRIPPFLTERVISTWVESNDAGAPTAANVVYQLIDPGWPSFPFLLHTHLGRVQFVSPAADGDASSCDDSGDSVRVVWEVEIRPHARPAPSVVEKLVEMVTSTLLRNLIVHWTEPEAAVKIRAPRGKSVPWIDDRLNLSVPKDSWIGGVLDAHLSDDRPTWEQTLSLFRPWTWGRSGTAGARTETCKDSVTLCWSDGPMPDM